MTTVNIHGKEYETVASRVQRFRESEVTGTFTITTELLHRDDDTVVMKASILNDEGRLIATGHAEEKRNASTINRTSALEVAETSAIGRALAAFGMAGTEFASADEVAQAIHQQSAPKPASRPSVGTKTADTPATPVQKARIKAFLTGKGIVTGDGMVKYLEDQYGIIPGSPMTKADADNILQELAGEAQS